MLEEFPQSERLGRVSWYTAQLKERPDYDSKTVGVVYPDTVLPWLRETVGYWPNRINQRFVETPEGYIWPEYFVPVRNEKNVPLNSLPSSNGEEGMWVEVTVPWVDVIMENPPPRSSYFIHRVDNNIEVILQSDLMGRQDRNR
jgi:hypothetical protein